MNKQALEAASDRIEKILRERGLSQRITGGVVTPRSVRYTVSAPLAGAAGLNRALASALGAPGVIVEGTRITVPRADAPRIGLLALLGKLARAHGIPPIAATMGICDDGAPLLIRMTSPDVGHVMLSGAGAADLARVMVVSLAACNPPRHVRWMFIGKEFRDLRNLPGLLLYADNLDDGTALTALAALPLERAVPDPRIVIVMSGLDAASEMAVALVQSLLSVGHAAGISVIAVREPGHSSLAFQTSIRVGEGERPGDFAASVNGDTVRFTAASISPAEIEQLAIGKLPQREPSRLRWAAELLPASA